MENNKLYRALAIVGLVLGLAILASLWYFRLTPPEEAQKQADEALGEEKTEAEAIIDDGDGESVLEEGEELTEEILPDEGSLPGETGGGVGEEGGGEGAVEEEEVVEEVAPIKHFSLISSSGSFPFKPQFSLKEITVNKGDKVKISINVTSGSHNFKLDEFGVFADTPTGQVTTVEFIADKAGEFIFYCNMPGHRAAGQWGTLKVVNPLLGGGMEAPKAVVN